MIRYKRVDVSKTFTAYYLAHAATAGDVLFSVACVRNFVCYDVCDLVTSLELL